MRQKQQKAPDARPISLVFGLLNTWTADIAIAVYVFYILSQSGAIVAPKSRRRISTSALAVFLSTFTRFAAVCKLGPLWIVSMYGICLKVF